MRALPLIALLVLGAATGCSPAQRQAAGVGVVALGLTATTVGVELIDPCLLSHKKTTSVGAQPPYPGTHAPDSCRDRPPSERGAAPQVGLPLSFIGLGAMVLGGILYGTGLSGSHNQSQHGSAATPLETHEDWPTPHRSDNDF